MIVCYQYKIRKSFFPSDAKLPLVEEVVKFLEPSNEINGEVLLKLDAPTSTVFYPVCAWKIKN